MILRHARNQIEIKGEYIGIREMRKHVAWYTAGMRHSAGIRRESNNIASYEELKNLQICFLNDKEEETARAIDKEQNACYSQWVGQKT